MCGILGIVALDGSQPKTSESTAIRLRDVMTRRGPDDAGLLKRGRILFGHRRLAIRDIDNGQQPWLSENGECALVYNGEIYNDDELRDALRPLGFTFRTRCDTEVLMAAWLAWGEQCLERLRGMFAFGVYDFRSDELFLVRDRCGVKPLFYTSCGGEFVFASSMNALVQHPKFSRRPNLLVLSHYLATLRLTLGDQTVFQNVHALQPGELLHLRGNGPPTVRAWWSLPDSVRDDMSYDEAVSAFSDELRRSVKMRLKSDVDVGMLMSGGVDSNTLAVHVRDQAGAGVRGICGGGDSATAGQNDDFDYARQCAGHLGFDFDEERVSPEDYFQLWQALLDDYATPVSTPTDVIIARVCGSLKRRVGVALGGEGADEVLCGYEIAHWSGADFDRARRLHELSASDAVLARASLQRQYGRDQFDTPGEMYVSATSLIPLALQAKIFRPELLDAVVVDNAILRYYDSFFPDGTQYSTGGNLARMLQRVNLSALLGRLDSASMYASLETRVPYTDHVLVEQAFALPHGFRIDIDPAEQKTWLSAAELSQRGSLRSKRILRSIANGLLPSALANRPKASFPRRWLPGCIRTGSHIFRRKLNKIRWRILCFARMHCAKFWRCRRN